tara:strand:+ start:413427 stop:415163 length:1737 start_codon:yes stop_codon:yes gene_type:complete
MARTTSLNLDELDSYISGKCGGKEFYFGCWSPDDHGFQLPAIPNHFQVEQAKNWIAIRNSAENAAGLLFPKTNDLDPEIVIFRGYLSEAAIHSYSPAERVKDYWSDDLLRRHNGIFSAVRISMNGRELSIVTDIFGLNPIYVRKIGSLVFFSSTPALLSLKDDTPNKMSWFMRLASGFIPGREALSEDVELAPEASVSTYTAQGLNIKKWYNYDDFPRGDEKVTDTALEISEQKFSVAMERCRNVHFGDVVLPLSSGYDSRRIFAHLEDNKTPFSACTVQSLLEGGEDVEVDCAVQITHDFNIDLKLFKYPSPEDWHNNDIQRIYSMDAQSQDHTWSVPLFTHYDNQACSFYDGTGGDIFGFNDWVFRGHLEKIVPKKMPSILDKSKFPPFDAMKQKLMDWKIQPFKSSNSNILTFLLWQTRKSSITWAQQQARPGHLMIYPYFDLDYIHSMLRFANEDQVVNRPQKAILYKYWPRLASYRGTREMPKSAKNILYRRKQNNQYSLKQIVAKALKNKSDPQNTYYLFTFPARWALYLSQYISLNSLPIWWLKAAAELIFWWNSRPNIIELDNVEHLDQD